MKYIIADLEWNGTYSKKAHGYFNEIIEIGATFLNDKLKKIDSFHCMVRPEANKKLTHLVTDLTGIEDSELKDGLTFAKAMTALRGKIGNSEATLLTWSNTDLLVLTENFRYFFGIDYIPGLHFYADAQEYFQQITGAEKGRQVGLSDACAMLNISDEGLCAHRALDDSEMTARVFAKIFDKDSFQKFASPVNERFYAKLNFKPEIIGAFSDPAVKSSYFSFTCPDCSQVLKVKKNWHFFRRFFSALLYCPECKKEFDARVQIKTKFEGVSVKRKLKEKIKEQEEQKEEQKEE